ncbi:uncharacterized protein LOC131944267 isoform X2 [Physella acuta]|uniref:uncharacterized protein LOC131944267 isoform X2 n=1 Tax=Physella acuta TaxID=109671 RepID=UPI0027DB8784|nr:uncharacterized protein LOC131944267 isoform X2 [Physella acuta]
MFEKNSNRTVVVLSSVLVWFLATSEAGRSEILQRLKDKSWPWFGDSYQRDCPDSTQNPTRCFNIRPQAESVLERAGLPSNITLTTDLDVVFSSPKEKVDVCGKSQEMDAVKAFRLNENGQEIKSHLELGSQIYRRPPRVNWSPNFNKTDTFTLIIYDVGLLKVRAFWSSIKQKNGTFQGETSAFYQPPANPLPIVNPILIVLLKKDIYDYWHQYRKRPTKETAIAVREKMMTMFGDGADVVGLQVFYTDGSSMFEKYMACTEGYICDKTCTQKFREYADNEKIKNQFVNLDLSGIDMYVNMYFYAFFAGAFEIDCCHGINRNSRPGSHRGIPGDDFKVDSYERLCQWKCHGNREIEISSTELNIYGDNNLYTFFGVVTNNMGDYRVQTIYKLLNVRLTDIDPRIGGNDDFILMGNTTKRLFFLLFSSVDQQNGEPSSDSLTGKIKLPEGLTLRGISWIDFDNKYITPISSSCDDPSLKCPPSDPTISDDENRVYYTLTFTNQLFEEEIDERKSSPPTPPSPSPTDKPNNAVNDFNHPGVFMLELRTE